MKKKAFKILLVDNDEKRLTRYRNILEEKLEECNITHCDRARAALEKLESAPSSFDVILVENRLPDMSGLALCSEIAKRDIRVPRVIAFGKGEEKQASEAIEAGVDGYFIKNNAKKGNRLVLLPAVLTHAIRQFNLRIDRSSAQDAREESEDKFRKVFMLSPDTVFISTLEDGRIIDVNENVLRHFGYTREELTGKISSQTGIISPGDREVLKKVIIEQGFYTNLEMTLFTRSGEARTCLLSGHRITIGGEECIIQTVNDITAWQAMEEELLKSKNLETIGILAGGIAHDFNALLTSIMGNLSMAKLSLHDVEKIHRTLSRAEEIAIEASELAGRLLTFSEGGEPVIKECFLTSIINSLVEHDLKSTDVKIRFRQKNKVWSVQGDEAQLKNLIHNILLNAVEAIPHDRQGQVTVNIENLFIPWDNRWALVEGNYVKLSVEDNGTGIPEKDLEKIFAPYYSTKDTVARKGVGLGLSVCQSIVKKHNGHIDVQSQPGQGSVIDIYLPAFAKETPWTKESDNTFLKGTGKILVMDDEAYVGDITNKMLRQMGYRVQTCKEGSTAVASYRESFESGDPYNAVILNLHNKMGMGGEETLEELKTIDPQVKAIASSGYLEESDLLELKKAGFCDAMKKPYSITRLSIVLNSVTKCTPPRIKDKPTVGSSGLPV
jgi:PAS domain S-box-containing protein